MTGLGGVQVHYKGSPPGTRDLLAGNVQFMFNALPSMLQHIQAGKLGALGVGGARRSSQLPNVPPVKEVVPGYEVTTWHSFFAPAGSPKAVIERVNRELSADVDPPGIGEKVKGEGAQAYG